MPKKTAWILLGVSIFLILMGIAVIYISSQPPGITLQNSIITVGASVLSIAAGTALLMKTLSD
ncbi:MAG: hypothetical protein HY917_04645 [Candidatus Diapherotrites archaeon]|nr:hypothetical protein [Candidatus Diapherotrites archaeon]